MPTPWSRHEVASAVAAYRAMLAAELRGDDYVKRAHRLSLMDDVPRSEGSIEYKHANISAALIDLGMPYISGYQPRFNYQRLITEVVSEQFAEDRDLLALIAADATSHSSPLPGAGLLPVVPPPPERAAREWNDLEGGLADSGARRPVIGTDFLKLEAQNMALGYSGEKLVLAHERARLTSAGRSDLTGRVEHVSESLGDGLGYDIRSFDDDGSDRFIEVKTTRNGLCTPFYVSSNELSVSLALNAKFYLYRLFALRHSPQMYLSNGPIDSAFRLTPIIYRAQK